MHGAVTERVVEVVDEGRHAVPHALRNAVAGGRGVRQLAEAVAAARCERHSSHGAVRGRSYMELFLPMQLSLVHMFPSKQSRFALHLCGEAW